MVLLASTPQEFTSQETHGCTRRDVNNVRVCLMSTAGLDMLCGHTKNQFAVRTRGLCTADLNTRMKSSRRGASTGGVQKIIFLSWVRLVESSKTEVSGASEVPQSHGELVF